jgi:hypothetical protein
VFRITSAGDALRVAHRPGESDHAAPVVHHQRQRLVQPEARDQRVEVLDAALQAVVVGVVAGLVGQAAADVVGHDAAIAAAQRSTRLR